MCKISASITSALKAWLSTMRTSKDTIEKESPFLFSRELGTQIARFLTLLFPSKHFASRRLLLTACSIWWPGASEVRYFHHKKYPFTHHLTSSVSYPCCCICITAESQYFPAGSPESSGPPKKLTAPNCRFPCGPYEHSDLLMRFQLVVPVSYRRSLPPGSGCQADIIEAILHCCQDAPPNSQPEKYWLPAHLQYA